MTGPEHYREAEKCIAEAEAAPATHEQGVMTDVVQYYLALGQIHATLALVAATAVVSDDEQQWRDAYAGGDPS